MPGKVWFIKNIAHERAGLLALLLDDWRISYEAVDLDQTSSFPRVGKKDAVVVLGGPDSANDETPKIIKEIQAIQNYLKENIPFLGICLGLQLLAKAAGGRVFKNPVKEVGFKGPDRKWFEICMTAEGLRDPLFQGWKGPFKIFQLHGETVALAPGMTCLAEGAFCKNQIVKVREKAYGIQGHVELDEKMFEDWLCKDGDLQKKDPVLLRREFKEIKAELETNCRMLFKNFLGLSGLI
ncbi:MAG TPA: type 1 glutamine amidotransferase [Candidatus Omnitrophota bacterium]|nr:type 1 glutamine amidotransferase [Candidatus Omnitrophota bacterium]